LARNDNILVLPFATQEDGLLWQADADFYFRLGAARLTLPTAEASGWPVLQTLYSGDEIPDFAVQLQAFLDAHAVKAIIVDARTAQPWHRLLGEAGLVPRNTGEVLFYPVTAPLNTRFRGATARTMAQREAQVSFSTLVDAADCYLAARLPLAALNPWRAKRLNLIVLPGEEPAQLPADPHWWRNLWLGPWGESMVGIGIEGDYDNLQPLVEEYRADATDVFFPFPHRLVPEGERREGQLLITFTADGLRRVASKTNRRAGAMHCGPSPHQAVRSAGAPAK
jgi:hypothetical protein